VTVLNYGSKEKALDVGRPRNEAANQIAKIPQQSPKNKTAGLKSPVKSKHRMPKAVKSLKQ
jgi:hypothetical protein